MKFETFLSRFITIALFSAVIGGVWDAWWHGAIGRESFLIPPHLLIYSSTIVAVISGIYGWRKTKHTLWRNLAMALILVPLSGPFDEFWHRTFGIEKVSSPLIVWSPPHLMLIGAIIAAFALLLPILKKDPDPLASHIFSSLSFGAILVLTTFLAAPLEPTGPYHLIGFWGAGFSAFIFVLVLLLARRFLDGIGSASLTAIFFLFLIAFEFQGGPPPPTVEIPPHNHPPHWLSMMSIIIPAVLLDLSFRKIHWIFLGGLLGFISNGLLYFVARFFLEPQFQYGLQEAALATIASLMAGVIAGFLMIFVLRRISGIQGD